ncbi:MAG TPA: hypothetical protein PLF32_04585 [Bacteroidales bacterium]|nr:hypothetical protein [Bacteroidales bacterium]HON20754.1 hypothetical protein [Bacteroidales bacterium]HOR81909.1 hypothetical protein [Bacteroidales bacterium]HPJ91141.1 hypothetical protein [Bacteroidales bacterium]
MNKNIEIKEVVTNKDIRLFIQFSRKLYSNCPYYVPSLEADDITTLQHHPAHAFCDMRMWLAFKNGKIVGRIAGIINHKYNAIQNKKRIRFGWFDAIDDYEVFQLLFQTVEKWGKEVADEISGPSRFSNMEKQGLLIEGFDKIPPIPAEYNYPYYANYIEKLGYQKEVDYLQYRVKIKATPTKIKELNNYITNKYNVKLKKFSNKKEMKHYAKLMFDALNKSYKDIYNFIPLEDKEIDFLIKNNFSFIDKDLVTVLLDKNDELIGFSLCVPSLSKAFQKAKGKLFPFGWYHILKAIKKNTIVDMYLTGLVPAWSGTGIHILYHSYLNDVFIKKGFVYADTTQQLEDNTAHKIWNKYESEITFKRRCYVKQL